MRTKELYLLWMAEGMISSQERGREETLTEVAERYLCELANRCMVQITMDESSTSNRFESSRLHDLMRDLCLFKVKEEGLLEVIDTEMGRRVAFSVSWLAVHLNEPQDNISEYKNLRSLLFFSKEWEPSMEWNNLVSIDFGLLKSLKILKLEGCKFVKRKFPKGIETLILLKHLSVYGSNVDELPSYVCKLPCVHFLDLRTHSRIRVPNSIYKMRHLRHLYLLEYRSVIGCGKLKFDDLNELETLSGFHNIFDDITHLPKLAKLRVLDGNIHDDYNLSVIVDHILSHQDQFWKTEFTIEDKCNMMNSKGDGGSSNLLKKTLMCHSLTGLNILCCLNKLPSYESQLGRNLITLRLLECRISEDPMEMLENLPMLRKLVLSTYSFVGREMVCRKNGFSQLNSLHLSLLPNLVEWRVEEKAMPNLSKLEILEYEKLEMILE